MRETDLILKVFPTTEDVKTKEQAMQELKKILSDENYINAKAAGSLGGAVSGDTLERDGDIYKRVK